MTNDEKWYKTTMIWC